MADKKCFVGIDTSNYTTSFAVCDENGRVIANIKKMLDVKEGERGLRQSDAVFSHVKNFPIISEEIRKAIVGYRISALGVSDKPRDREDSYMPCFMTGVSVAEVLAASLNVPLYRFSHQSGHVMASLYSCKNAEQLLNGSFIAFHVSGGTTEALHVSPSSRGFDVEIVADTADISAGQAIDRTGVLMGMRFPCGRELEKYALAYSEKLPAVKTCIKDGRCNLSGLENIAKELYSKTQDKALVSAYVLEFIGKTLDGMTDLVRERYPKLPIVYAGGVMSNKLLQNKLSKYESTYFAEPQYSADNAAGIALLAKRSFENK